MWQVIIGAVIGGAFTLAGGVIGQARRDRRVQRAAAQLIYDELLANEFAIENFLQDWELAGTEAERAIIGDDFVAHTSTSAWMNHAPEVALALDDELRHALSTLYAGLQRNKDVPGQYHAREDWPDVVAAAKETFARVSQRSRFDRYVWRL
jgi:hypothetical protein